MFVDFLDCFFFCMQFVSVLFSADFLKTNRVKITFLEWAVWIAGLSMGDSKPDIPIPDGLQKLMQDFVVTVLRQQPHDVLAHAAEYFTKLKVTFLYYDTLNPHAVGKFPSSLYPQS